MYKVSSIYNKHVADRVTAAACENLRKVKEVMKDVQDRS